MRWELGGDRGVGAEMEFSLVVAMSEHYCERHVKGKAHGGDTRMCGIVYSGRTTNEGRHNHDSTSHHSH